MEIFNNNYRFRNNYKWENLKHQPYNYKEEGLVKHLLSNKIVNSTNPITKFFVNYFESAIVFMFKAADNLKNFKNFNWKN